MMRTCLTLLTVLFMTAAAGCTAETSTFRSAVTGEACEPDPDTFVPKGRGGNGNGNGGHNSPTGIPGDNIDDERSGKVDCLGDGDSGQGNDARKCPPAGCDAELCCEEPPPPPDDGDGDGGDGEEPPPPPEDGDGDGGDGDGDGGGGEEPPPELPPVD